MDGAYLSVKEYSREIVFLFWQPSVIYACQLFCDDFFEIFSERTDSLWIYFIPQVDITLILCNWIFQTGINISTKTKNSNNSVGQRKRIGETKKPS